MNTKFFALLALITLLFSTNAFTRSWNAIEIPGAKCGNGSTYKVWVHKKENTTKLAIELMGGGACWSKETCFGTKLRAWIFPLLAFPKLSVFSSEDPELSPAYDASMIYFPYCTGDVHVGDHVANYQGHLIYHWGKRNVELSLKYLQENHIINFNEVSHLMVYGGSAGALGGLAHAKLFASYIPKQATKTMIADSPGMHFGKKFWDKFSPVMFNDLKSSFGQLVPLEKGDGFMAKHLPQACSKLASWNVGFLQGSRDIVMSVLFGNISQDEHERLVYSDQGVTMKNTMINNCSSFVVPGPWHTFLITYPTAFLKVDGISAIDYMFEVARGRMDVNYN